MNITNCHFLSWHFVKLIEYLYIGISVDVWMLVVIVKLIGII